jgi:fructose/tagatose bisphosphate aldolase
VVDEDHLRCDYAGIIGEALELGYGSVMVDGSRLPLEENIRCTAEVTALAARHDRAVEAELGAVLGHEDGPLPPYEELFARRVGFTTPEEAARFVRETGVDWLSVSAGNLHGAISAASRRAVKPAARLDLDLVASLHRATGVPLVLHGGSGIPAEMVLRAAEAGIAKINIGTATRQPYEKALAAAGPAAALDATYAAARAVVGELRLAGTRDAVAGD